MSKHEPMVKITWWGRGLVRLIAGAMRLGLVEPTVSRAEAIADWLLRLGALKVERQRGSQAGTP